MEDRAPILRLCPAPPKTVLQGVASRYKKTQRYLETPIYPVTQRYVGTWRHRGAWRYQGNGDTRRPPDTDTYKIRRRVLSQEPSPLLPKLLTYWVNHKKI